MTLTAIGLAALIAPVVIGVLNAPALRAQSSGGATFETASVKPVKLSDGLAVSGGAITCQLPCAAIPRNAGGRGTSDPGRIHYPLISLKSLLARAWGNSYFEITSPDWLDSQLVAVEATMASTTTKEQFEEMLQNLVKDRFKLQYHVETKAVPGYELVATKGSPKLKQSASPDEQDRATYIEQTRDFVNRPRKSSADGWEIMPRGFTGVWFETLRGNRARIGGQWATIEEFARALRAVLKSPLWMRRG